MLAFDAAARHGSFARAARELFVTQAAVSQQIKRLEEWLGCVLFERHQSFVKLTPAGERLQPTLHAAFESISNSALSLRDGVEPMRIRISALPNVAVHWLIPRMHTLLAQVPQLQIDISTAARPLGEIFRDCDIAIRTWQDAPEYVFEELFGAELIAVASPALLGGRQLTDVRQLTELRLIHFEESDDWERWFDAAGVPFDGSGLLPKLCFDSNALVLAAAKAGLGVALVKTPFIASEIERGELIQLFPVRIPGSERWYLVLPRSLKHDRVAIAREWLLQEGIATRRPALGQS